jgi:hypothetical protein
MNAQLHRFAALVAAGLATLTLAGSAAADGVGPGQVSAAPDAFERAAARVSNATASDVFERAASRGGTPRVITVKRPAGSLFTTIAPPDVIERAASRSIFMDTARPDAAERAVSARSNRG